MLCHPGEVDLHVLRMRMFGDVCEGFLNDATGDPITIQGLWAISFGNSNPESGPINTLYYTGGGTIYTTGVFGAITAN